jgi:PHP-associated
MAENTPTQGRAWYRGDCHVHSVFSSGGELTPRQLADTARAAGLDFIATTEHNSADSHRLWGPLASDDLLVILGQEVVTESGHWLALGLDAETVIDWRYGLDDDMINSWLRRVHEAGGLCVAAHPYAPYPTGTFCYPYEGFDAVEVWNGLWTSDRRWNADNEAGLVDWTRSLASEVPQGAWRPALGDSDTHQVGQLGTPMTVVSAERLSTEAILTAIRAGRSWLAESVDIELSLTAQAAGERAEIGETLAARGRPVSVRTEVTGVPSGVVSIHTERGEAFRQTLPPGDDGSGAVEWSTSASESAFIRVEVRHPDGLMAALTNPIILV